MYYFTFESNSKVNYKIIAQDLNTAEELLINLIEGGNDQAPPRPLPANIQLVSVEAIWDKDLYRVPEPEEAK